MGGVGSAQHLLIQSQSMTVLEFIASLAASLAWPILVAVIVWLLWRPVERLLSNAHSAELEVAGAKISLAATVASRATIFAQSEAAYAPSPEEIGRIVAEAMRLADLVPEDGAVVLWVDDRPGNNVIESAFLKANGIELTYATSTDEALQRLAGASFDAVISDMGRPGDDRAGYTLLEHVKKLYPELPYIIYAGESTPEQFAQAQRRGAVGCTNRPEELYAMTVKAIHSPASSANTSRRGTV